MSDAHDETVATTAQARARPVGGGPESVHVVIVDDQAIFRVAARRVIDATPGFQAVGEAASGQEGIEVVAHLRPELVLLDVRMPGLDGIDVAGRLTLTHPATLVVLVSAEEPADLSAIARVPPTVPRVRKQDLGPRLLCRLWEEHRP